MIQKGSIVVVIILLLYINLIVLCQRRLLRIAIHIAGKIKL